jgi:hypothetical protein
VSRLHRLRYACEGSYFSIRSALRRPGRIARFARFCRRAVDQKIRPPQ